MILDIVVAIVLILIVRKADTNIEFNNLPFKVLVCSCVCVLHAFMAQMPQCPVILEPHLLPLLML